VGAAGIQVLMALDSSTIVMHLVRL